MKQFLKSYSHFSRAERMGIVALLVVLLVLVLVRATMHLWVQPPQVDIQQVVLAAEKIKQESFQPQYAEKKVLPPGAKINLNTADSLTLIALPGIGKGLSHRILERRRQLGKFSNMQEVLEIYKFRQETKDMLLEQTYVQ